MKDIVKYRRGQVYFMRDDSPTRGAIQSNYRPYIIVSNDVCNAFSPVIHMAPITSKEKPDIPTHVKYIADKGENVILCEQTTIKLVEDIDRLGNYLYTVSDEVMSLVDRSLAVQFGIPEQKISWDNLDESFNLLKKMRFERDKEEIERLAEEKAKALFDKFLEEFNKSRESDIFIESLTETIKEVAEDQSATIPPKEVKRPSPVEKFNKKYEKYLENNAPASEVPVEIKRSPSGRIKWTEELKTQYLRDCEHLSKEEVCKKYDISGPMYYAYRKKFKDPTILVHVDTPNDEITLPNLEYVKTAQSDTSEDGTVSDEYMRQYIKDFEAMTLSLFMEKYNLSNRKVAILTATRFKDLLSR